MDHQKNFLWASRVWVPKTYENKNLGTNRLKSYAYPYKFFLLDDTTQRTKSVIFLRGRSSVTRLMEGISSGKSGAPKMGPRGMARVLSQMDCLPRAVWRAKRARNSHSFVFFFAGLGFGFSCLAGLGFSCLAGLGFSCLAGLGFSCLVVFGIFLSGRFGIFLSGSFWIFLSGIFWIFLSGRFGI